MHAVARYVLIIQNPVVRQSYFDQQEVSICSANAPIPSAANRFFGSERASCFWWRQSAFPNRENRQLLHSFAPKDGNDL